MFIKHVGGKVLALEGEARRAEVGAAVAEARREARLEAAEQLRRQQRRARRAEAGVGKEHEEQPALGARAKVERGAAQVELRERRRRARRRAAVRLGPERRRVQVQREEHRAQPQLVGRELLARRAEAVARRQPVRVEQAPGIEVEHEETVDAHRGRVARYCRPCSTAN